MYVHVGELESLPAERGGNKYNAGQGSTFCDDRGDVKKTNPFPPPLTVRWDILPKYTCMSSMILKVQIKVGSFA